MILPETVNASWIATLRDDQLLRAEASLHAAFSKHEKTEKQRMGARYEMLRGSEPLVSAWLRWSLVNNETRTRGLAIQRSHA